MINKNFYRKTNDKKILHKVGKQWKVISVALLLAIGGGAAVAANANADANANVSPATQAEVSALEQKPGVASAVSATSSSAAKSSSASAKPSSAISYLSGYNGSAASYHAKVSDETNTFNTNNTIVQSYVDSLNTVFPSQTSSLTNNYNSAKDQLNNDKSAASSYSTIAATSGYASEVISLANKAGMTSSAFIDSVGYQASTYNNEVSVNSKKANEMSTVNSYAQLISELSGNDALQAQYGAKATSAAANEDVDANASAAAGSVFDDAVNNSKVDATMYNDAKINLGKLQGKENIAMIQSGMDARTTNAIASAMGYTNSSVTSSITSSYANSAADEIASASKGNLETISYVGVNKSGSVNSSALDYAANDSASAGVGVSGSNVHATRDALYHLISNTAVMDQFDSLQAFYSKQLSSAAANESKDASEVSSAASVSQSTNNAYLSASSEAHVDAVLADPNVNLGDIFNGINPTKYTDNGYTSQLTSELSGTSNPTGFDATTDDLPATPANDNSVSTYVNAIEGKLTFNNNDESVKSGNDTFLNDLKSAVKNAATNSTSITGATGGGSYSWGTYKQQLDQQLNGGNSDNATQNVVNGLVEGLLDNSTNGTAAKNNKAVSNLNAVLKSLDATKLTGTKDGQYLTYYKNTGLLNPASYSDVATGVQAVASQYANNIPSGASVLASSADSYANNYVSASSASVSYSNATDENVTLASSYATSYSNDAANDALSASAAKNSLDDFYTTHADGKYTSASNAAASAGSAAADDNALAHANGMHVFNYGPKYVTVTKNAQLHSDPDYTAANTVAPVKVGTQFQVIGVGFAANGITRFLVNSNKGKLYLTGNTSYVEPTYLQAANGVSVTFTKDAKVYTDKAATKATGQIVKAGTTLPNVNIVSLDNAYIGSSRIETPSGNYVTANTKYVSLNGNEATAAAGNTDTTTQNNGIVNYWN